MNTITRIAALGAFSLVAAAGANAGIMVYATDVADFSPGLRKDGKALPAVRADPTKALGAPDLTDTLNFVSLGFGGSLTLTFDTLFTQSVTVWETTWGNNPAGHPESADVFVGMGATHDVADWWLAGTVHNTADGLPISLSHIFNEHGVDVFRFVRIVDTSDPSKHSGSGDGFDVDGVGVFAVIPAPGAGAMLAGAMLLGLRRRRS